MAGNPERVAAFTGKIRELAKSGLEKDLESLRNAKELHRAWSRCVLLDQILVDEVLH